MRVSGRCAGRFAYYREVGDWEGNFPMRVRITSVNGETLEDTIASAPHRSLFLARNLELRLLTLVPVWKAKPTSTQRGKRCAKRVKIAKHGQALMFSFLH